MTTPERKTTVFANKDRRTLEGAQAARMLFSITDPTREDGGADACATASLLGAPAPSGEAKEYRAALAEWVRLLPPVQGCDIRSTTLPSGWVVVFCRGCMEMAGYLSAGESEARRRFAEKHS